MEGNLFPCNIHAQGWPWRLPDSSQAISHSPSRQGSCCGIYKYERMRLCVRFFRSTWPVGPRGVPLPLRRGAALGQQT